MPMDAAMMVRENRPNTTLWLIGLELSYSSIIQAMDNNVNRDVRFTTRARPQSKF